MKDQDLKHIDDYLGGLLSKEEEMSFEQRLSANKELKEEYEFRKQAYSYLRRSATKDSVESQLPSLNEKYFSSTPKNTSSKKENENYRIIWLGLIAAAIALLLIFKPFAQKDLYTKHGQHSTLALIQKSLDQELLVKAESSFNQKNYKTAYGFLSKILINDPDDLNVKLALGICALEMNNTQEAQRIFEELSNSNSAFNDYGTWYLALVALKKNDHEKTKIILDQLDVDNDPFLNDKKIALIKDLQ